MNERLEKDLIREGLKLSSYSKRVKAYLIDEVLITTIIFVAFWDSLFNQDDIMVAIETINSLFFVIVSLKVIYQTLFIHIYGATLGKIMTNTIVVNIDDFSTPSLLSSFFRAVGRIGSEMAFYMGFAWAFLNPEKQTWQDKIAKTIVIDV